MSDSYDYEIRDALHKKKFSACHSAKSNTVIINELGLLHGSSRIDIAVINGLIHGYEIKSSKDTLKRLNTQIRAYSLCLQKLTFVVAPIHLEELIVKSPAWAGIVVASKGVKGGISFKTFRRASVNPEFDLYSVLHLLWKEEAQAILKEIGFSTKAINVSRKNLYSLLCENLEKSEIVSCIKDAFGKRLNWRAAELQALYGD